MDIHKLEEISDYSISLMEEIQTDINKLSEYTTYEAVDKLEEINKKIDLARGNWVKVDALDKQILDFRIILFNKDYDYMIEKIKTEEDKYEFDLTRVDNEFKDILSEPTIDHVELIHKMKILKFELIKSKIRFMIRSLRDWEWNSPFTFDRVFEEMATAKEMGINIDDIESMLYE